MQLSNWISLSPSFRKRDACFFPERRFPLYSLYQPQPHTSNHYQVKRPSQHPPWRSSWTNVYLANFVIYSLSPENQDGGSYLSIGETSENLHFARNRTKRPSMTPSGQRLAIFTASPANPSAGLRYWCGQKNWPSSIIIRCSC